MTKDQILEQLQTVIKQQQPLIEQQQKQIEQILLSQPSPPVVVPCPAPYPDRQFIYDPQWKVRVWVKNDNTAGSSTDGWQLTDAVPIYPDQDCFITTN